MTSAFTSEETSIPALGACSESISRQTQLRSGSPWRSMPAWDATLSGFVARLGAYVPRGVGSAFALASIVHFYLLAANLNPLVRTDGYHALDALVGAVNMRGRSMTFVLSIV